LLYHCASGTPFKSTITDYPDVLEDSRSIEGFDNDLLAPLIKSNRIQITFLFDSQVSRRCELGAIEIDRIRSFYAYLTDSKLLKQTTTGRHGARRITDTRLVIDVSGCYAPM
jgi:hypothetical protein